MHAIERRLRSASDMLLDDTVLESEHSERALALEGQGERHARLIRRVLLDGEVTPAEALELAEDALAMQAALHDNVVSCAASFRRNVETQRELTVLASELRGVLRAQAAAGRQGSGLRPAA